MSHRFHTVHDGRQTLEQGFAEIIANKQRASQARSEPRAEEVEAPGVVFAAACAEIGRALEADGFRYSPSGHKCSKKVGDYTFDIRMSSDHYNVAGQHVLLRLCGIARSRRYKQWQKEKGFVNPGDMMAA